MTLEELEKSIREEAEKLLQQEPLSVLMIKEQVTSRKNFSEMLSVTLSCQLAGEVIDRAELERMFNAIYAKYPELVMSACKDLHATVMRDPACTSYLEPMLFFKGFQGLQAYRVAHVLWEENRSFPAKMLQSIISRKFGMDIHPAAKIGYGLLIDHATNIVIGETAVIGNNVSLLHGVTLGGTGNEVGDRHPKLGAGVMVGAHAQLLGNIHIGDGAKIGAGAVVVSDVPAHTTYAGVPAVQVGRPHDEMPSFNMQQDFTRDA
ncbi:MAG: serine O-acetyltransferase [Fibrobacter sp.]|nr:serine O-acetyltransferase [Fibrobacter sp.]